MSTDPDLTDRVSRRQVLTTGTVAVGLLSVPAPAVAGNSDNTGTFEWLFGEDLDPLLDEVEGIGPFGDSVTLAKDGSRIEISGSGTFTIGEGSKSIDGGGTYTVFGPDDAVVASGDWAATHLRGYIDYGEVDELPEEWRGGKLTSSVELAGLGTGKLTVHCLIGNPPPSKEEGVQVDVGAMHFHDSVEPPEGGPTLFIHL
jgi:hypothetical protein